MKFLTPAQMTLCLLLFFLPWVEIQCPMPKGGMAGAMKGGDEMPNMNPKDMVWVGLIEQSGLQAASGSFSFSDPTMQQMAKAEKKDKDGKKDKNDNPDAAPLLWVYLVAVLAGVGLGFALPSGGARKGILVICCALALATAGGQAAMGFPVEKSMKNDKMGGPMGGGKGGDAANEMFGDMKPKVKYKLPFYLSLLLCVGGLVTALIEPSGPAKSRKRYDRNDSYTAAGGDDYDSGGDSSND